MIRYRSIVGAGASVLLALLAAAIVGALGAAALVARHYEPQLAAANQELGEFRNAYDELAESASRQNNAINQLKEDSERRRENARQAAQTARGTAQPHFDMAATILGLKPPPGADPCRTASADFDAELRAERGAR